jgi:(p)ppGpp synthase/HD superfamily hydrolase
MNSLIDTASAFAINAHGSQTRKDGVTPYHEHLKNVVEKLKEYEITDTETLASAWLHDVVEDTDVTFDDIRKLFGDKVAGYVDILTRTGDDDIYINRLKDSDFFVKMIKYCDVMSNLEDLPNSGLDDKDKLAYHERKEKIIMAILPEILEKLD